MPTVADVALIWQQNGVSVVPILANRTKRPAVAWSAYQQHVADPDQVENWWAHDSAYGLALICGHVSGNLEMTEIEGRALTDSGAHLTIIQAMDEGGAGPVWDLLTGPNGYAEDSPSGGMHLLYRISDHDVPGNEKIAADESRTVLAETRGEGGYVIVAPTGGECHPSGGPWILVNGNYGHLPTITWDERQALHRCLKAVLDKTPPPLPVVSRALAFPDQYEHLAGELTPGDAFEAATDWSEILEPHGWRVTMTLSDGTRHWVRPNKDPRDGMSATTGRAHDRDRLYVFSTSTVFESEVPYTKFGAYALLNHHGDHSTAASALARKGFGGPRSVVDTADVGEWSPPVAEQMYTEDDIGNGHRLADRVRGQYRYIWEEKQFYRWDGRVWTRDVDSGLTREWSQVTSSIDNDKWRVRCRSQARYTAAVSFAKGNDLTHSTKEWAPNRSLINLHNGVLDLRSQQLSKHDPKFLMTQMMGCSYDPSTTCPHFSDFIAAAVPDDGMRAYVQRALGYSLLGDADQRSIFLIYGPSGTGKSTLIETISYVFGDYGTAAGSGTFRTHNNPTAPSADLHTLKGKRFVTTSETAENTNFDEDLLKRLSGRDRIISRSLYQEPLEWIPECVVWVATNNPPKFNSDDNSIWRRSKLIPFTTVFQGADEITDFARKQLFPEAAGILNWLLAGLKDFLTYGLQEPEEIEHLALEQRRESDSVARFIQDSQVDGLLILGEGHSYSCQDLFSQYQNWARQVGERSSLSSRRFSLRLMSWLPGVQRQEAPDGRPVWTGVTYRPRMWVPQNFLN